MNCTVSPPGELRLRWAIDGKRHCEQRANASWPDESLWEECETLRNHRYALRSAQQHILVQHQAFSLASLKDILHTCRLQVNIDVRSSVSLDRYQSALIFGDILRSLFAEGIGLRFEIVTSRIRSARDSELVKGDVNIVASARSDGQWLEKVTLLCGGIVCRSVERYKCGRYFLNWHAPVFVRRPTVRVAAPTGSDRRFYTSV